MEKSESSFGGIDVPAHAAPCPEDEGTAGNPLYSILKDYPYHKAEMSPDEALAESTAFFTELYAGCKAIENGVMVAVISPGKELKRLDRKRWYRLRKRRFPKCSPEAFLSKLESYLKRGPYQDVYYGVGLRDGSVESLVQGRRHEIIGVPAVIAEIDFGRQHAANNVAGDETAALEVVIEAFGDLPPSAVVCSGGGFHLYWFLDKPWIFESDKARDEAMTMLQGLFTKLNGVAQKRGWLIDNVGQVERILRLPGSQNCKDFHNPKRSYIVYHEKGLRYSSEQVRTYLEAHGAYAQPKPKPKSQKRATRKDGTKRTYASTGYGATSEVAPRELIDVCRFLQHCRDDAEELPEPEWFLALSVLAHLNGGEEACHEISAPYPGYSPRETQRKIEHVLEARPVSCGTIIEKTGGKYCGGCENCGGEE